MKRYTQAVLLAAALGVPGFVGAMSPQQLRGALENGGGEGVVVIDIRSRAEFQRGHVPGALRLPAVGLQGRRLPSFGRVVIVWDGIDEEAARRAAAALDDKPGIDAELLDGGYPAWANAGGYPAAANPGRLDGGETKLVRSTPPGLTWKQLMNLADDPQLVVMDLRHAKRDRGVAAVSDNAKLTDLAALLPNARIVAPRTEQRREMRRAQQSAQGLDRHGVRKRTVPNWLRNQRLDKDSVYVLVDAGDGQLSERVARRMAARGMKRVYMLLGGERTLASRGESDTVTLKAVPRGGVDQ